MFYHCISRVVDRRFVLGADEKEKFRALMRIYEKFSGCTVVSYCLMDKLRFEFLHARCFS